MTVTRQDASNAIDVVLQKYGAHLPQGVASAIRAKNTDDVIKILPGVQYQPIFDDYFASFFAPTNAKNFGLKRTIGVVMQCGSFGCPAFCSPASSPLHRTMYINADKDNTFSTLCHEMCHYISHGNFYPEFYAMGGDNPDIVEGVTEYLTRNINSAVRSDRETRQKYVKQYDMVSRALIAGSQGELDVIRFALRGDYCALPCVGGVKPNI
jgi:hypothetical protein